MTDRTMEKWIAAGEIACPRAISSNNKQQISQTWQNYTLQFSTSIAPTNETGTNVKNCDLDQKHCTSTC